MGKLKALIVDDWKTYGKSYENSGALKFYLTHSGAKISCYYRLYHYYSKKNNKILSAVFRMIYHKKCVKYGCDIPSKVEIGSGICLPHPIGVVVNSNSKIGKNVTIMGGVCIGHTHKGNPEIGDNVYIGANTCIIGPVKIGDNVVIGAGSVVIKNVSQGKTVIGNPAKELR